MRITPASPFWNCVITVSGKQNWRACVLFRVMFLQSTFQAICKSKFPLVPAFCVYVRGHNQLTRKVSVKFEMFSRLIEFFLREIFRKLWYFSRNKILCNFWCCEALFIYVVFYLSFIRPHDASLISSCFSRIWWCFLYSFCLMFYKPGKLKYLGHIKHL